MPSSRIENRVSDLLADAREARDAGDWKTARSLLDAVNALDPGNAEASAMLAGAATRRQMTLLFCDIVGSTERAAELGDRDWTALLSEHHAIVREQLERFRGKEIRISGDGFLATFDGPARAVRCACAMRDAVRGIGLDDLAQARDGVCG